MIIGNNKEVKKIYKDNEAIIDIKKGTLPIFSRGSIMESLLTLPAKITAVTKKIKDLKLYGNTSQEGTPTPDTPVEIQNVTGLQTIEVEGKNLLPYPYTDTTKTVNGITFTDLGDGTIKVNGTASANAPFKLLGSDSQQYAINGNYICGGLTANIRVQVVHHNPGYTILGKSIGTSAQIDKNTYATGYIEIVVQSGQVVNNQIIKPMLTLTQDNVYEEYKGNTYEINLGKNLFDNGDIWVRNNNANPSDTTNTNTIRIRTQNLIKLDSGKTYTLSGIPSGITINSVKFYESLTSTTVSSGVASLTFTVPTNAPYVIFQFQGRNFTNKTNTLMANANIQLEKGSQATSYSPYKTPIELCKIGTYQDRIYKDNGKWYLHKEIGKVVLDGSESGGRILDNNQRIAYNSVANPKLADVFIDTPDSVSNLTPSLSTHFSPTMQGRITTTNNSFGFSQWGGQKYIYISAIYDNIEDFKTWLSTHNTIVYYVLATPTTTEITDTELISQLNAIELVNGDNYINSSSTYLQISQIFIKYRGE